MSQNAGGNKHPSQAADRRRQRLEEQLRANLRKRKDQARGRANPVNSESDGDKSRGEDG